MLYDSDWNEITRQACDKFMDEIRGWIEEDGYYDLFPDWKKVVHDVLNDMINNRDRPEDREDLILLAQADMESIFIKIISQTWPEVGL